MNILVIGSGGREHALCWAIAKSPLCDRLYCAPGNAGIAELADCASIDVSDQDEVTRFCREKAIGFVVIGPEASLVAGLVDHLKQAGIKAFGPSAKAARLEGSKGFTKDLCAKYGIPTAAYARFNEPEAAKSYASRKRLPMVIKADGLAAGKGVIIAETHQEAENAIDDIFSGRFGDAGAELVIEEFLKGEEASFFALSDGNVALALAGAQDHKRVGDGDTGPNTGGMGAYSPAPVLDDAMRERVIDEIIRPTIDAMRHEGAPYHGVLYAGLMITEDGPKLIEYNVRFGDPECQVLMMRLASDIVPALLATVEDGLADIQLHWLEDAVLTVVMAAQGYPGAYDKGTEIKGLEAIEADDGTLAIFHAGTKRQGNILLANGGRVLNITARGRDVREARQRAYAAIDRIDWPEGFCRKDIGWRALDC